MTIKGFENSPGGASVPVPVLDETQRRVVDLPLAASAAVIGAPGTGKTTTIVELVADRIIERGWSPGELLALGPTRTAASRLRDRLALRLAVPTEGPLARTVNSLAFEVVAHARRLAGQAPPRLLTGGDQDSDIGQLLAGHLAEGTGPDWPDPLGPEVLRLRGFRTELRELMMRATEYDLSPERLSELGRLHGRPEWAAAAAFQSEYLKVMGDIRPNQLDAAELVSAACRVLASDVVSETVSRLRLVLVDDLQEATRSTLSLLHALAGRGIAIIAFGDPDVATNAFRGGEPSVIARLGGVLGLPELVTLQLGTEHRQGASLRAFTAGITDRIGTAGTVGHRRVATVRESDSPAHGVLKLEAATPARELAAIARRLREHHLSGDHAWNDMAVVVRSGGQVPGVARALALADVPTRTAVGGTPLRDDHAARSLLRVVDIGIGRAELTAPLAVELLLGPFGGLDRLTLRRLRLALRAEELAGGGHRSSDELLVEALAAPGRFATIDHRTARSAEKLAATLSAAGELADGGGTIEELLWLVWDRSGLAEAWRQQALSAGILAAEANRNLDGILALFTAAKRFVEREPGSAAAVFLGSVLDAEVPEDTLSPQPATDSVLVTTPSGVVGLEFEVVAVAGLQDGVWPNLRLRGSLLYPGELVRIMNGLDGVPIDGRKEVLGDELRMFALAVSRARSEVILSAVANEDEAASVFFSLIPDGAAALDAGTLPPLTLRGITGRLRRELVGGQKTSAAKAAAGNLAVLAEHGVPGANPADWHGLREPSTTQPVYLDDETVPVSPSKLEAFEDSPLDWFIDSVSGTQSSTAMGIGTIVHWAMETATDPSVDAIWASIDSRWNELVFEAPWLAEQKKRATRILAAGIAEYLGDFEREKKELIGAEDRFELEIDRAVVRGSIDRVERSADGSVVIVDLKTGAPITKQSEVDEHPQLGVYQLAYASGVLDTALDELGEHHAGGAKLLYVKEGYRGKAYREGFQAPLSEEELEGFRERIRQAAIGMAAASFTGAIDLDGFGFGDSARRALHRVGAVSGD